MPRTISSRTQFRLFKFFRKRLLTLDSDADIVDFLERYDKEVKAIKQELLRICWYMRGGISYTEASLLSNDERMIIADIIKDNFEIAKESKMPFW